MTVRMLHPASWGLAFALASPSALAQESSWRELPLAVSSERLAIAAGLEPPVERWRLLHDVSLRIHPASGGHEEAGRRLLAVAAELARPEQDAASAAILVPVPLPPGLWREAVLASPVADSGIARALLLERPAALVYRGTCQLDPETLGFFERHPGLLKRVRIGRPEIFALVAGSLRVRAGRVVVPGGAAAAPLWEGVVGARVGQPELFLQRLLDREEGRVALLLNAVQTVDLPRQRFALGLAIADPARRAARFRALARASARLPRWWQAQAGSPTRPLFDPAAVLGRVRVGETGALAPPASRAFWATVFADGESGMDGAKLAAGESADAAWLAEQIGQLPTPIARTRVMQLAFAQRVFTDVRPQSLAQSLLVLRQLAQRPALVLVLERIGFQDPALYAEVLRGAEALEELPRADERVRALAQFEGALAVVDRARRNAALDAPNAQALAVSLSRVRPSGLGYGDALASWLDRELLPALAAAVGEAQPRGAEEDVWLRALAGARAPAGAAPAGAGPVFDWEGLPTRADPAAGELSRLARVRARQAGNPLPLVLELARLARMLAAGRDRDDTLARLRALRIEPSPYPAWDRTPALPAILRAAAAGRAEDLLLLRDGLLAETLVSLAYAPHLGPADGAVLAGANVARRHDLSPRPFALPQQISGTGAPWHVRGSLLALELALAPLSLRRITTDLPSRPPGLDARTLASFALVPALLSPVAMRDADAAALAAAIERGNGRARELLRDPSGTAAIARDATLEPWRVQALAWLLVHEPRALESFFSLAELLRLGGLPPLPAEPWGLPEIALGGGLLPRWPQPSLLQRSAGQDSGELLASALLDPLLKVVTELSARRLPACLAPATLALLTQAIADHAPAEVRDDPHALARFLLALPGERFDDYVSALVGDGPLVPAEEPPGVR